MSAPGKANAASDNPIGRRIAPSKATAKAATESVSVAMSLKSSHRAVAPAHRYVWNAVLDEWFPRYLESEPLVPGSQGRLRIEEHVGSGPVGQFERAPHQPGGQSA